MAIGVTPTLLSPLGCGSTDGAASLPDAGPPDDAQPPPAPDAAAPHPDSGAAPVGVRLFEPLADEFLKLVGTTEDGFVVFETGTAMSNKNLYAVPLTGGAPRWIAQTGPGGGVVKIFGSVVLVWTNDDHHNVSDEGPLKIWTAASGTAPLASRSPFDSATVISGRVVFWKGHGETAPTNDIVVADLDGSHATTLVSDEPRCKYRFDGWHAGVTAAGAILATVCVQEAGESGTTTLASFATADGYVRTDLAPHVTSWSQTASKEVAIALVHWGSAIQDLVALPSSGGAPVFLDELGVELAVPCGEDVVYVSYEGELKKRSATAKEPAATIAQGIHYEIGGMLASPDGHRLLTRRADGFYETTGLISLDPPARFERLEPEAHSVFVIPHVEAGSETGPWARAPFTTDSKHALVTVDRGPVKGTYLVAVAAGTGERRVVGGAYSYAPLDGARVLYSGYDDGINVIDLATTSPPKRIVEGAGLSFVASRAKDRVAYYWVTPDRSRNGLYVIAIP